MMLGTWFDSRRGARRVVGVVAVLAFTVVIMLTALPSCTASAYGLVCRVAATGVLTRADLAGVMSALASDMLHWLLGVGWLLPR